MSQKKIVTSGTLFSQVGVALEVGRLTVLTDIVHSFGRRY